ncbi:uncharacterized protein LOC135378862 [Ornithodoros turicata]|uniref:uncharacterized protein LOC135378862 n=1 Tax=Ornithodoros turicata TaxID=34597 RepID=UPI003139AAAB
MCTLSSLLLHIRNTSVLESRPTSSAVPLDYNNKPVKEACVGTEALVSALSKLTCLQQKSKQTSSARLPNVRGLGARAPTPRARSTTPELFSFQRKLEESLHKKAEFIAHERQRSQEHPKPFSAQPPPSAKQRFSLKKTTTPVTKVEPFNLLSEARHHHRVLSENEKQRKPREYEEEYKQLRALTCKSNLPLSRS